MFAAQFGMQFLLSFFTTNQPLIQLITSLVLAFGIAIFFLPKEYRKHFYKLPQYHAFACIIAIVYLVTDMIIWLM